MHLNSQWVSSLREFEPYSPFRIQKSCQGAFHVACTPKVLHEISVFLRRTLKRSLYALKIFWPRYVEYTLASPATLTSLTPLTLLDTMLQIFLQYCPKFNMPTIDVPDSSTKELMDYAKSLLSKTWVWLIEAMNSIETQLKAGEDFDTQVNALCVIIFINLLNIS